VLFPGQALPHFNEVDEGAAVDALLTNRVWTALGLEPSTTLHDIRWGENYPATDDGEFVWLLMISGAAPASHFVNGYASASSERQPPMYFPQGGGTLKGVAKPGSVVWSRVYLAHGALHADLGLGEAVELPAAETERRWQHTDPAWPIMHLKLHGVSRDQLMARHKANHIQVAYADDAAGAQTALAAKAAALHELGVQVHLCGNTGLG
jgi:L-fucose isomerase-like protein